MAADTLAMCVTRTSTAMVLIMQNKQIPVVQEEAFQLVDVSPIFWNDKKILIYFHDLLTHWGLVTPYGHIHLGQQWLR